MNQKPAEDAAPPIPLDPPPPVDPLSPLNTDTAIPLTPLPQTQLTDPIPQANEPPSSHKKIIFVLVFLFLIVLIGTGSIAAAYNNYKILPVPKAARHTIDKIIMSVPLPKTTRLVLSSTEFGMATVKSAQTETEFKFETTNQNFPLKSGKITIVGPVDFKTQSTPRSQFDISGSIATEGLQLSAAASIRQIDDTLYFKLTQFPGGSLTAADSIKNQWFYTKDEHLQKQTDYSQAVEKIRERISQFTSDSKGWSTLEDSDSDVFKILIKPPKDEIAKLVFDLVNILEPKDQNTIENSLDQESIKKFTDKIQEMEITLEINKKGGLISKSTILVPIKIPIPAELTQQGLVNLSPETPLNINFSITTKFTNYNQPVIVEIPQDAKNYNEYAKELVSSLSQELPIPNQSTPSGEEDLQNALPNLEENDSDSENSELRSLLDTSQIQGEKDSIWNLLWRGLSVK